MAQAVAVILEDFPEIILPYADTYFDQDVEKVGTVCFYW